MTIRHNQWCKILIVDDELLIRQGIKHALNWSEEGFKIVGEASNGIEALDLIAKETPHIVITDMVMPIMGGEELTKEIKLKYPTIEVIVLSSFSDFEYVRSTFQYGIIDYILKPQLEGSKLLETLHKTVQRISGLRLSRPNDDAIVLVDSMIQRVMDDYRIDDNLSVIKDVFPLDSYCLFVIDLTKRDRLNSQNLKRIIDSIESDLSKNKAGFIHHFIRINQNVRIYLINFALNEFQMVKNYIAAISSTKEYGDANFGLIISNSFTLLSKTKEIYLEKIVPLVNYRFYYPNKRMLFTDSVKVIEQKNKDFQLTTFLDLMKHHDLNRAFNYLDYYKKDLSQQDVKDEFVFKAFISNIIFNITSVLGSLSFESKKLEQSNYETIALINDSSIASEVLERYDLYLAEVKKVIEQKDVPKSQANIQRILDYIDNNYAEQLSLNGLATHFHYNPSYLSALFSDNHDQGFSEYLTQVRIKKSLYLLEDKQRSIAEVSSMVGYSDHSYFCRVFKNSMNMSPSVYRRDFLRTKKQLK